MLLRGVPADHSHDDVVTFCESHILVGEIVVGLDVRRGENLRYPATEHKTKEPLGYFVSVAGKCQTFIERGVGGPKGYRMLIHHADSKLAVRFIIMDLQSGWLTSVVSSFGSSQTDRRVAARKTS